MKGLIMIMIQFIKLFFGTILLIFFFGTLALIAVTLLVIKKFNDKF